MANNTSTITIPKWVKEISPSPSRYLKEIIKTMAFLKLKEYERKLQPFKEKYKTSFEKFEKKVKELKKENFGIWDDYLIWKGLHLAEQKWLKRYKEI